MGKSVEFQSTTTEETTYNGLISEAERNMILEVRCLSEEDRLDIFEMIFQAFALTVRAPTPKTKPCLVCGGRASLKTGFPYSYAAYKLHCQRCGTTTTYEIVDFDGSNRAKAHQEAVQKAVLAWNDNRVRTKLDIPTSIPNTKKIIENRKNNDEKQEDEPRECL